MAAEAETAAEIETVVPPIRLKLRKESLKRIAIFRFTEKSTNISQSVNCAEQLLKAIETKISIAFFIYDYFLKSFSIGLATIIPITIRPNHTKISFPQPISETAFANSVDEIDAAI